MTFDLPSLLDARRGQGYELTGRYLNPQLPRMLHAIGFDQVYERAEGAYLYDAQGDEYLDMLAGFGVFAAGPAPSRRPQGAARRPRRRARRPGPSSTPRRWPGCSPSALLAKAPATWTGSTSATAAPRRSRRR